MTTQKASDVMTIGWSKFAAGRHQEGNGYSYFTGSDRQLIAMILANWDRRRIGDGADSIDDVCLVPVDPELFVGTNMNINDVESLQAVITRRMPHEEFHLATWGEGEPSEAKYVDIVLYAAHELLKNNGDRSGDYDWEIVSINVSDVANEPMHPTAMVRNQLELIGGTPRKYTSEEWAISVFYWSQHVGFPKKDQEVKNLD